MLRKSLLLGLSTVALTAALATPAAAQAPNTSTVTQTNTDPGMPNEANVNNNAVGNEGNVSVITQTGVSNSSNVTQTGLFNTSTIAQDGTDNDAQVSQDGEENTSNIDQEGEDNIANSFTLGDGNFNETIQTGDRNDNQQGIVGVDNSASATQTGNDNVNGTTTVGDLNVVLVEQDNGDTNQSSVNQGIFNGGVGDVLANSNTATVRQYGSDNGSTVSQQQDAGLTTALVGGVAIAVSGNTANVTFGAAGGGNARGNSQGNVSAVNQSSRGNTANVFLFQGVNAGAGQTAAQNNSLVTQGETGGTIAGGGSGTTPSTATGAILSRNSATVTIAGFGNSSSVTQNGRSNVADITIQRGGGGGGANGTVTRSAVTRGEGNSSTVSQRGTGSSATVVMGSIRPGTGVANVSTITQVGSNHSATVFTRGVFETISITQNAATAQFATGAAANRSIASVFTLGDDNDVTVNQTGDVSADITQGIGTNSLVDVLQSDAGEISTPQPDGSVNVSRGRNSLVLVQYGDTQVAEIDQTAIDASATVFQSAGNTSGATGTFRSNNNNVSVQQGSGQTTAAVDASGGRPSTGNSGNFTTGSAFAAAVVPAGQQTLRASVEQSNGSTSVRYNNAVVRQDGSNLTATAVQRGNGLLSGGTAFRNLVLISQQGTNNIATGTQNLGAGVSATTTPRSGPSGNPFARTGRQSAEIVILQRNTANSASVTQNGPGQLGRIEQSGSNNVAEITQNLAATNAVAVIRQTGSFNTYSVTQANANDFIVVDQTGNNNAVTNIVQTAGPNP